MSEQRVRQASGDTQQSSPLQTERGGTRIEDSVVEKIAEAEKHGRRDVAFFTDYLARNPDIRAEVGSASTIPVTVTTGDRS